MSLTHDANPMNWGSGLKALAGIVAVLGTLGAGMWTVGGAISNFSRLQTQMVDQIKALGEQIAEVRNQIVVSSHEQDSARSRDIGALQDQLSARRSVVAPRIDKIESAVDKATTDIAAANAQINDMQGSLNEIRGDVKEGLSAAKENLSVSRSHSEAIEATRNAVVPKTDYRHPQ